MASVEQTQQKAGRLSFQGVIDEPPITANQRRVGLLLAHGAGGAMDHPWMNTLTQLLLECGICVAWFDFDYRQQARQSGARRPPDRMPKLIENYRARFAELTAEHPQTTWFVGGKSMGGRVAASCAPDLAVPGVVCLGYPFHPAGKPERLRLEPLQTNVPQLVIQGTRDPLGNAAEVAHYGLSDQVCLRWLEDGDHDLKPRKKSGFSQNDHLRQAARWVKEFVCVGER